jgi:WD40 repeat protein
VTVSTARANPYVGPRSFRAGESLYGRETELNTLVDLFIAERIVLLYSPSGAGKTSLLQAGLIPQLVEREGFRVLPIVRVSAEPPVVSPGSSPLNRFRYSTIASLEEDRKAESVLGAEQLAGMTLDQYLRARHSGGGGQDALVFDQFEEFLTIDPSNLKAKEAFLADVAEALRDRNRWALFAMREDYVAALDPYLAAMPTRFTTRFRLDFLGVEPARDAIQSPARALGVTFTKSAADKLLDDLRSVRVQRPEGPVKELGPHVEPVQLQVVCRDLWDRVAGADQITDDDLAAVGSVDEALAQYYVHQVDAVCEATGVSERAVRTWFETELITKQGLRGQALTGPDGCDGTHSDVVRLLEDGHLIRAEKRRGATWYELAHDRLIDPIQASNRRWLEEHLSALQSLATLWNDHSREAGLLLGGESLVEAERWAARHASELSQVDKDFLTASRAARAATERERHTGRVIRRLALAGIAVSLVALALLVWAVQSKAQVRREQARSTARVLASHVISKLRPRLDVSLLLDVEGLRAHPDPTIEPQIRSALLTDLEGSPQLVAFLDAGAAAQNVAFSPDGKVLAAGTNDGKIHLWDAASHRKLGPPLVGHTALVGSLAFSPDGKTLVSASDDETVIVWDLTGASPKRTATLSGHGAPVTSIAVSADSSMVASGSQDRTIKIWEIGDRRTPIPTTPITTLRGHGDAVTSLAFSPTDPTLLASGSNDKTVILWDTNTSQPLATLKGHRDVVRTVAFSPDGKSLASGSNDKSVIVWDVASHEAKATLKDQHLLFVRSVAFSPDGAELASASEDRTVVLWDLTSSRQVEPPLVEHTDFVTGVAFSPDGLHLASSSRDHNVILWSLERTQALAKTRLKVSKPAASVAFRPDGTALAAAGHDNSATMWDLRGDRPPQTFSGHNQAVTSVAFSPDGKTLAAGSVDKTVIVWNVDTLKPVATLAAHTDTVTSIAFSPDGQTLASGSADTKVILWDLRGGRALQTFSGHQKPVTSVAFSPDGKSLASGSLDETVIFWTPGADQRPLKGGNGAVQTVAFSADGKTLAAGGNDGTIVLWDVARHQKKGQVLAGHGGPLTGVSFSPDGRTLASSSMDGTVILWDLPLYSTVHQFLGQRLDEHSGPVASVAFDSSGKSLASGGTDETVVWDTDPQSWQRQACSIANRNLTPTEWEQFIGSGRHIQKTCPDVATR